MSRGVGARVIHVGLPHAQSAVTEHWLKGSVVSWACYIDNGPKDVLKSSWPSMEVFTKHWHKSQCSDRMWQWQAISDELSVTRADLVSQIFGANLERWPLPSWPEALKDLKNGVHQKKECTSRYNL